MEEIIMYDELKKIWMEATMAYFKVLSSYLPEKSEDMENLCQNSGFPGTGH
jgi:hypothetical protein